MKDNLPKIIFELVNTMYFPTVNEFQLNLFPAFSPKLNLVIARWFCTSRKCHFENTPMHYIEIVSAVKKDFIR